MVLIIKGIILSIVIIVLGFMLIKNEATLFGTGVIMFGTIIFMITIDIAFKQDKPTAMDVYRGKTTLKITYVDSVAVDSVVVFKEQ